MSEYMPESWKEFRESRITLMGGGYLLGLLAGAYVMWFMIKAGIW